VQLLIVAKQPRPGFAKTRLMPAYGPEGAAALASAALADTFAAAAASRAERIVVAFDGDPTGIVPDAFEVIPQRDGPFDVRLAGAWEDAGGPGLQIGMDTPQVTAADLDAALDLLALPGNDAVLGPALDGGWWAIGLHQPDPAVFLDVPMSKPTTGARQLARLADLGLATSLLPSQRDVDEPDDVDLVAAACPPGSRFAAVSAELRGTVSAGAPTQEAGA
jgi:rSAM/selenodomain-associated transferase 1